MLTRRVIFAVIILATVDEQPLLSGKGDELRLTWLIQVR